MLLDGASGLLLVLGISVVLNVVVFMYFRNKTMALENKVDIMFNIVQEHAAMNSQQSQPVPQQPPVSGEQETQENADNEEPVTPICCRYSIAPDALKSNSLFPAACCCKSLISSNSVCLCCKRLAK